MYLKQEVCQDGVGSLDQDNTHPLDLCFSASQFYRERCTIKYDALLLYSLYFDDIASQYTYTTDLFRSFICWIG